MIVICIKLSVLQINNVSTFKANLFSNIHEKPVDKNMTRCYDEDIKIYKLHMAIFVTIKLGRNFLQEIPVFLFVFFLF